MAAIVRRADPPVAWEDEVCLYALMQAEPVLEVLAISRSIERLRSEARDLHAAAVDEDLSLRLVIQPTPLLV